MKLIPPQSLTVIIRDETPLLGLGEPCLFRRVTVKLTQEQIESLALRYTGKMSGNDTYEAVSHVFLEF